ncbi:MAG: hypothetical protein ACE5E8_06115 [Acidimicrobiia bacterium]
MRLLAVRLPIPWHALGFDDPASLGTTTVGGGLHGWLWDGPTPEIGVAEISMPAADEKEGWAVDHVVVLVPHLDRALQILTLAGLDLRLRAEVRGRPTAFLRAGTVVEVIEESVAATRLYGVALVTDEPLESVALRWRSAGFDVADPHPALQPGRHILSVADAGAGLAVMTPDGAG